MRARRSVRCLASHGARVALLEAGYRSQDLHLLDS